MKIKIPKKLVYTKFITVILLFTYTLVSFNTPYSKEDEIIGNWLLPDNLEVKIFKKNHKFYGKITDVQGFNDGQEKDIHNPDKSKRNDELLGKIIISGLKYDPDTEQWVNGTIYAPQKGFTLDLTIIKTDGKTLEAKGSKLFFNKTIIWKRL
ncbi:MAG TPA: DUF2147 domain-containing protein [Bacteroidales bacterium]|nr:DUF2147 domain-containing protein [Bacteroidales bacterium]